MKSKLKYNEEHNEGILSCQNVDSIDSLINLINRFGFDYSLFKQDNQTVTVYFKVSDKSVYKRLNSFWKSAKQFL